MKYEEALKVYSVVKNKIREKFNGSNAYETNMRLIVESSYLTLKFLVLKNTPKKPIKEKTRKYKTQPFIWVCPNCKKALPLWFDEEPNEVDAYCGCCGQHIDWSEYDKN